ncbi:DNA polymerase III subunit delta [Desulfitobacterium sp.]|nr:DNA polymerase III subunit delta [Desulfitobacterium sp.]MEA4902302.1 DNA polymerase III subunit delta [Desulfitobacterium sp.]
MREIEQIKQAIQTGLPSVYLWYGEEHYLLQEAIQLLKSSYLETDPSGSGIEVLSARNVTPLEIIESANTVSFFQGRLLIVEDIPYFQEGQGNNLDPFFEYFKNPNPGTCLLFLADSVHKGRKFYKAVEQAGVIVEFTAPKRVQDWHVWLDDELKERGKKMRSDVKTLFLEWAGHQPGVLSQELDKLVLYVGDREMIRAEDIKEIVPQTSEATIFELLDAVAARSSALALQKLHQVLRQEHPLKVLTLMVRQVRMLLGTQALRQKGGNVHDAPRLLGMKPYEAQKVWKQSEKLSWQHLVTALQECLTAELGIKTGKGEATFLLELMVAKFCTL